MNLLIRVSVSSHLEESIRKCIVSDLERTLERESFVERTDSLVNRPSLAAAVDRERREEAGEHETPQV